MCFGLYLDINSYLVVSVKCCCRSLFDRVRVGEIVV